MLIFTVDLPTTSVLVFSRVSILDPSKADRYIASPIPSDQ
jgi:hypothetical protein